MFLLRPCTSLFILNTDLRVLRRKAKFFCQSTLEAATVRKKAVKLFSYFDQYSVIIQFIPLVLHFSYRITILRCKADFLYQPSLVAATVKKIVVNSIDQSDAWRFEYAESAARDYRIDRRTEVHYELFR